MKYVATYTTTPAIKAEILLALRDLIADSYYYSMNQNSGGSLIYGSGLVSRRSSEGKWCGFRLTKISDEFPEWQDVLSFEPTWEWVKEVYCVGWITCGGNTEIIWISDDEIRHERAGRRHGITNYFNFLREVAPLRVVEYQSERTDMSPWDKDLLPN